MKAQTVPDTRGTSPAMTTEREANSAPLLLFRLVFPLAEQALQRVAATASLSPDVGDIVQRALAKG